MAVRDANGVPILSLGDQSAAYVDERHNAYLQSEGDEQYLLTGAVVIMDNPRPINGSEPDLTIFHIGGETLDEALKSVVGTFDDFFAHQPPAWVSSNNNDLAQLLAEHYGCEVKPIGEGL